MSSLELERELQKALKRLWVHGRRTEIVSILSSAQLKASTEELDRWVLLDDEEWSQRLSELAPTQQHELSELSAQVKKANPALAGLKETPDNDVELDNSSVMF